MSRLTSTTTVGFLVALSMSGLAMAARPPRPAAKKPSGGVKIVSSEADPSLLAAAAAPSLTQAAADFKTGRQGLTPAESGTGTPAYAADEVAKVLATAEGAVQKALGDPELAALRDRAVQAFRRARTGLGGGQVAKDTADAALGPLGQFLDQLAALAAKGPVTVDLCVISKPEPGARFSLRPAGDPGAGKTLPATDGTVTAVRGLYVYRLEPVEGAKGKVIQCGWDGGANTAGCLDLFDDPKTPLVCDFAQGSCKRAAGTCP